MTMIRPFILSIGLSVVAVCCTSCSVLTQSDKATPPPHAFIKYTPPPQGDTNLRLAVKDLIDMKGEVTSAGSKLLYEQGKRATKDAACLRIARQRGVTFVGKANLSEFAVGVSGKNAYFGTPVNPIDRKRMPGGSSSGSAVAVALGLADVALGTDTAGSIRVPAACCGVAGLKTTFGLVPIDGVYPISPTYLDTVGPLAKDVSGLVSGMGLLQAGFEQMYAEAKAAKPTAATIRIGRLYVPKTNPAIDEAIDQALRQTGFEVVRLNEDFLEAWESAQKDGNQVAAAAAWYSNQKFEGESELSLSTTETIWVGDLVYKFNYKDEKEVAQAFERREAWRSVLRRVFTNVDAIALPVLTDTPLKLNSRTPGLFEAAVLDIQCTAAVNFAGNPALAVPVPLAGEDFPVTSIQLLGPRKGEASLLNIGRLIEAR